MKKQLCHLGIAILLLVSMLLSGCGGSFFEEETLQIIGIEREDLPNGNFNLVIKYKDDVKEPDRFEIEKGDEGQEGVGILRIDYKNDPQTNKTIAMVSLSNGTKQNIEIENGVSVTGIDSDIDETTGAPYIVFLYSNGDQSPKYFLPRGEKGNGIKKYEVTTNDDKSVNILFEFDEGDPLDILIPAPQEGNGIESMAAGVSGDFYTITVNYTHKESEKLEFPRPADPNAWISDARMPEPGEGKVGDYFFDTAHAVIYLKSESGWDFVVSLKAQEAELTLKFNLNDEGDAQMSGFKPSYKIKYNSYFSSNGYGDIPVPTRAGYTFMGWYTKPYKNYEDIPATMAPFTDLTPVLSDMTLYAIWAPNN